MSNRKLCKDCKWYFPKSFEEYPYCGRPEKLSPVNGEPE